MVTADRQSLQTAYVKTLISRMDLSTLVDFAAQLLSERIDEWSDERLVTEIKTYHPHILERFQ